MDEVAVTHMVVDRIAKRTAVLVLTVKAAVRMSKAITGKMVHM